MYPGAYSASLVFPRYSNFCLSVLLWLRHPIYTRAVALARAQDPAVYPIKVALELIEGLQGEEDRMCVKIHPIVYPILHQKSRDCAILQLHIFTMMCFIFTHFIGVICTSSFCVEKKWENGSIGGEYFVSDEQEEELVRFQLCVLLYISQSTLSFSLHFYFEWKKDESHLKDVKPCLQNYFPK